MCISHLGRDPAEADRGIERQCIVRILITAAAVAAVLSAGVGPATADPVVTPVPTLPDSTSGSAIDVNRILGGLQSALICSVLGSTSICAPLTYPHIG
ncbi:hypothetical protein [Nocardia sp. NPDC005825]|uniref:hypothetical protein n=1 Tax=Nocardia sp. NPDC005825 TaxID=3155452 RepID=UPI0033F78ACE